MSQAGVRDAVVAIGSEQRKQRGKIELPKVLEGLEVSQGGVAQQRVAQAELAELAQTMEAGEAGVTDRTGKVEHLDSTKLADQRKRVLAEPAAIEERCSNGDDFLEVFITDPLSQPARAPGLAPGAPLASRVLVVIHDATAFALDRLDRTVLRACPVDDPAETARRDENQQHQHAQAHAEPTAQSGRCGQSFPSAGPFSTRAYPDLVRRVNRAGSRRWR